MIIKNCCVSYKFYQSTGEKQQLVSEVNLLRELKHPHIVRYHDRIIDRSRCRLYIVMEYCAGGDLSSLITKHRRERKLVDEGFVKKVGVSDCFKF